MGHRRIGESERRTIAGLLAGSVVLLTVAGTPAAAHADLEEQIAALTRRIADHPGDALLHLRRAELHRLHEDASRARRDYRSARKLDPQLHEVDLGLARLELALGAPAAALVALNRLLEAAPEHLEGLLFRARALGRLDEPLAAAADYDRLIARVVAEGRKLGPGVFLERADALQRAGPQHHPRALAGLDEGSALLGRPATLELAAVALERGLRRTDAALARLDRLAAGSARPGLWLAERGAILEGAGRPAAAREAFAAALASLETLPPRRRGVRAVVRLERDVRGALARLDAAREERP